jgi:intein/homing endonuclease
MVVGKVLAVHPPFEADSYFVINGKIRVTHTHPFLSHGRWVDAQNLKVGSRVTGDGSEATIYSVEKVDEPAMAYNFQVTTGTYMAGGLVVHNKENCLIFKQYPSPD